MRTVLAGQDLMSGAEAPTDEQVAGPPGKVVPIDIQSGTVASGQSSVRAVLHRCRATPA